MNSTQFIHIHFASDAMWYFLFLISLFNIRVVNEAEIHDYWCQMTWQVDFSIYFNVDFKPYKNKHTIKLIRQLKRNTKRYGRSPVYHSFGVFKIFSSCSMHNIHYSFFNMAWHNLGGGLLLPRSKVMMFRTQHPSFSTHFLEWTNLGGQSQFAIGKVVYSTRHW